MMVPYDPDLLNRIKSAHGANRMITRAEVEVIAIQLFTTSMVMNVNDMVAGASQNISYSSRSKDWASISEQSPWEQLTPQSRNDYRQRALDLYVESFQSYTSTGQRRVK